MQKVLEYIQTPILKVFLWVLIVIGLLSFVTTVVSFIFLPVDLWQFKFDFSVDGLLYFFIRLSPYIAFLTFTITIMAIYLAFVQIDLAIKANMFSIRVRWVDELRLQFKKLPSQYNQYTLHFEDHSESIFDWLYENNKSLLINSKKELDLFYYKFIKDNVSTFMSWDKNDNNTDLGNFVEGTYYSIEQINTIIRYIIKPNSAYNTIYSDLETLYKAEHDTVISSQ